LKVSMMMSYFVKMISEFESSITSVERVKEYSSVSSEADWEIENIVEKNWPTHGVIEFDDFSAKYRENLDFTLRNLKFKIIENEKIGIVGRTGAGKSSLTLALFRLLESTYGKIKIDNVNIRELGLHDLRQRLTIIPQDPFVFSGTIRENLDPFQSFTDKDLWDSLDKASLTEFVKSLKGKLDFKCLEGGENLSVGQRQLICLARAILRNTKILILDEATASIDPSTDKLIQTSIRKSFANNTVLIIAHRLDTILFCDRIMVLNKGEIVEFDSPENLLNDSKSDFYSMASAAGLGQYLGKNSVTSF